MAIFIGNYLKMGGKKIMPRRKRWWRGGTMAPRIHHKRYKKWQRKLKWKKPSD